MTTLTQDLCISIVRSKIQDKGVSSRSTLLLDDDVKVAIGDALQMFSDDKPDTPIAEITADGDTYNFPVAANLPGWLDDWSYIRWVEYPASDFTSTNYDPIFLDTPDDFNIREQLVSSVRTTYLYLNQKPTASTIIRVGYTSKHTLTGFESATATTIPAAFYQAFTNLVTSNCLMMLSNRASQFSEPTISADVVNYADLAMRFRQNAGEFMEKYREALGGSMNTMGQAQQPPQSTWVDWDVRDSWGSDRLFHSNRIR